MRRVWLGGALLTLVCFAGDAGFAQAKPVADTAPSIPAYRIRVLGVYDDRSGEPVESVDVSDVMSGVTARTTSTGTVSLAFLPEGGGLVRIRKIGYGVQTMMVSIAPTDTLPITVLLRRVVELPAVAVVDSAPVYRAPALRGFEERRRNAASGQFIPEALIRKEEDRNIGTFLRAYLSNAVIKDGQGGAVAIDRSNRCGAGGRPAVYLDGVLLSPPAPGVPVNLAEFPLTQLAGIEYYPNTATAPPQFNATLKTCGALLLWTRER